MKSLFLEKRRCWRIWLAWLCCLPPDEGRRAVCMMIFLFICTIILLFTFDALLEATLYTHFSGTLMK
jgi:hypothetical protein